MPNKDVTVTAEFQDAPPNTFSLTVNNGTGGGAYAKDTVVNISATVPQGKVFLKWTGDTQYIADTTSADTTVTMPNQDITVTAEFEESTTDKFSISGTISGDITSGITVYADSTHSAVTDANGNFTITDLNNGNYLITPAADGYVFSPENQNITISDSDVQNINFTSAVSNNHPPVAADDSYNMFADTELSVTTDKGLLANDFDQDNDVLTVTLSQAPSSGQLKLNSNGSFSYIPEQQFSGQVTFSYTAYDGTGKSNTAVVTINVMKDENQPLAVNDNYEVSQDSELKVSEDDGVMNNDLNTDNSTTVTLTEKTEHGTVILDPGGSFTYIPAKNFSGIDSFSYKIDGITPETTASVTLIVKPVNITRGMIFTLKKSEIGDNINFIKPPKMYGITSAGKKGVFKKVPQSEINTFQGIWNKNIRLYDKKSLKANGYILENQLPPEKISVYLKGKTADKTSFDQKVKTIFLVPPEISTVGTKEGISENSFKPGSGIYITGKYFGNKIPKISLTAQGVNIKCKIDKSFIKYYDPKGKGSIMDPQTGESALRVILPAADKINKGSFNLILDNKIGIATGPDGKTPVIEIE
jgi:hypothetical protein